VSGRAEALDPGLAAWEVGERTWASLLLLGTALALGVLGNALFEGAEPGVNAPLWVASLLAAGVLLARRTGTPLEGEGRWMAFPALFFAAALAWRASPALAGLNVLALAAALGLGAWRARGGELGDTALGRWLVGIAATGLYAAVALPVLVFGRIGWRSLVPAGRPARALGVARGVLLALPLLLVFNALFASADPVFGEAVRNLFRWGGEELIEDAATVFFWSWLAAGLLWAALQAPGADPPLDGIPRPALGATEIVTVLALLDGLFLAFVAAQGRYLFGGQAWVSGSVEMGWGEYARRGFFELVTVAALALPLLLALHALLRDRGGRGERAFRVLAGVLVALLFVVMVSAVQRMRLYQAAYGLTELRLYTTAFMAWLAVVLAWFAATVLRGAPRRFPRGAVLAGFAVLAGLNALNPDARIARTNLERAERTGKLDAAYLSSLSADAAPVVAPRAAGLRLAEPERCRLGNALRGWERPGADWRSWNWSRARAAGIAGQAAPAGPAEKCAPLPADSPAG
jgi:hypothetical protein